MKRLVVDETAWYDFEDNDTVTVNGNPVTAITIDSSAIGSNLSNLPSDKLSKDKAGMSAASSGRLTNVASFEG